MGNRFTAYGTRASEHLLYLSNGSTDVFFDVLTLAGCALAETPWQRNLVLHLADGHRIGRGFDGFDLSELPWTEDWPEEKAFLLEVVDKALTRYGWDRLAYDPPYAQGDLRRYRAMVAGLPAPVPVRRPAAWGDWRVPPPPAELERCAVHDIYEGRLGCRLCDPELVPLPPRPGG
ncbi:hypothetical protein GCM10023085_13830 [Actinomadura viridis]|uniref:Uncharacterized protein n=1 Tax=Actinomadura viridis TaxID=58110 RepID=A0A931GSB1_9ACTN|nr:hypothetical protein [Actinomadura viridis]MBG6093756.1 hypothetical protein [Actinomadura viridis]